MPRARVATVAFSCLTVPVAGLGAAAAAVDGSAAAIGYVGSGLALAGIASVSALLVSRRSPANVVGALLAAAGLVVASTVASDGYLRAAEDGRVRTVDAFVAFSRGSWMLLFIPFALLVLYFPTGRLPRPRWRVVPIGLAAVFVVFELGAALQAGPYDEPWQGVAHPQSRVLSGAAVAVLPLFLVLLVASAASVFRRYRDADAVERHQIRWLQLASTTVPLTLLLCWLSYLLLGEADLVVVGLVAMYASIPVTSALAILRHDRYDVDQAIVTTAVYGVIAAALLAAFTAVSSVAGLLAGRTSTSAAVLVTAVVAVALGTVRGRLVAALAGRLLPERARALAAVTDLRSRVHAGDALPEQLEPVLRAALRDPLLRVGYVVPGRGSFVDRDGLDVEPAPESVEVEMAGQRVGVIVPGPGTRRWLLADLRESAALLMETARLRIELARALQEAEGSRSRLLRAGYEERRRLERDLHDGAQQRLVSLGMSLRLAQRHLGDGGTDLEQVLDGAVAHIGTAVSELRQIAHGLRPSCLDDGLASALASLVSTTPLPVGLELDTDDLPDHVSTTAYYVASEAVANVVKHAEAESIAMSVCRQDDSVRVTVRDNGRGGADIRPGSGLASLRDRVAALGGTLGVHSETGLGTVVEAVLPCGS